MVPLPAIALSTRTVKSPSSTVPVLPGFCSRIRALQLWFLANRFSLNLVKTSYNVFGDHNVSDDFELKLGATGLKRVTSNKYLGIIIDDKLTWKEHIDYVYKNIVKFVGIFIELNIHYLAKH